MLLRNGENVNWKDEFDRDEESNLYRFVSNRPTEAWDNLGLKEEVGFWRNLWRRLCGRKPPRPTPGPGDAKDIGIGLGKAELIRRCAQARDELMDCLITSACGCCQEEEEKASRICRLAARVSEIEE